MVENLVDIVFGQLHSEALNAFMELMQLNTLIIIHIKGQECFGQTLELLLNLDSDQGHDLAQVAPVVL